MIVEELIVNKNIASINDLFEIEGEGGLRTVDQISDNYCNLYAAYDAAAKHYFSFGLLAGNRLQYELNKKLFENYSKKKKLFENYSKKKVTKVN